METYLLAHDLGTSGDKATLFSADGVLKGSCTVDYKTSYPGINMVEQQPEDWWRAVCGSTKRLLDESGINASQIAGISFSGQMMGCLLLDGKGEVIRPMITWADSRAGTEEEFMIRQVGMEHGYRITGHRLNSSYGAAKLLWIKNHEPDNYKRAVKMLNAKDYIVFRLTGRMMTDYSDASSTNLLDLDRKVWSDELTAAFGIRKELLPDLHKSATISGTVTREASCQVGLLQGTPVILGGGDGACACAGAGVVEPGSSYNVLGTSSWVASAALKPHYAQDLSTFNWVHLDENLYTPCGTMQAAGASYAWFRNQLGREEMETAKREGGSAYDRLNQLAEQSCPGAGGILYLPYLLGERSPRWDKKVRGAFLGLDISNTKEDMVRATLEGIGYNLRKIIDALGDDVHDSVTVIGGGARSRLWMQILADIWHKRLYIPEYQEEATSIAAAVCAGVALGIYDGYEVIKKFNPCNACVEPDERNYPVYDKMYRLFDKAYENLKELSGDIYEIKREG